MTFEGHTIKVIVPLDPSKGPRYIEPIREAGAQKETNDLYIMTTMKDDYINPTHEGILT